MYQSIWQYVLVFLAAGTPFIEAMVTVPFAIIAGLNPVVASLIAFLGNLVTVILVVVFYDYVLRWNARRLESKGIRKKGPSKRQERAKRVWNRFGLPGLSIAGPFLISSHVTIFMALALGASKQAAISWMAISLALWTILAAAATSFGFDLVSKTITAE
ncbi:small multi-drug export protein [Cytobacillus horneckiae]|uniref:small multi-drug export protein n=1 Tax=Cytobacillus horneckiae TaxID=549687 RepID=UPI00203D426D|nr:small multi-drug export protein [Cytobacillus horneckiae]MCM3176762.1 small multi-drug export protein [Cytobacillus horneckiae]